MTEKQKILSEMWAAGAAARDIAAALGISVNVVYTLRSQYGLPTRQRVCVEPEMPTEEEIAERARECRERHYAMRRSEAVENTWSKASKWRRGVCHPRST